MRSAFRAAVLGSALAFAGVAGSAAAAERIVIGELNWTGAIAVENVLKVVLEDYLDAEVEIIPADAPVMFAAMDKGDGSLDVYPELWMPNQAAGWAKYVEERGTVLVNDEPYTGEQGLFIPGYVQDEHGVKSVEDLKDPEIAKLFDTDGDGKGEYWPGGPGWESTDVEQVKAKSYGYDDVFEPFIVEQWVMEAKLDAAYKRKTPVLFYFWTPEWIHTAYDLRKLEEPEFTGYAMDTKKDDPLLYNADGCWNMIQSANDPEWLEKSSVTCAWPDAKVYVAHSKALSERAPEIGHFLKQVAFTPEMINEWILQISQEGGDPYDVAKDWVENNPDVVNQWLEGTGAQAG
jgi:glycine betaine/proline transport system substrate-binding protein